MPCPCQRSSCPTTAQQSFAESLTGPLPPPPRLPEPLPLPTALQTGDETPWIYEGSDVPRDPEWLWGKMDNGLRYAVRDNGVPPGQVAIRILIDAGSLHEREGEQGFAHLMEHLSFRESAYLGPGEAITRWQELGATFGSDTNATTSPTQTVYQLDLPKCDACLAGDQFPPAVGHDARPRAERGEPGSRSADRTGGKARTRRGAGAGRRPDARNAVRRATPGRTHADRHRSHPARCDRPKRLQAFHSRWYRPDNTVIVVAGDAPPEIFASLIETYFGDWQGQGPRTAAPDFGDPVAPADAVVDAVGAPPVGEVAVLVEPDLPRTLTYAVMRPWRPVKDTIVYNEGLLLDSLAQAIINRRLESRARAGGSFLYATVRQDDVSRSTDATFISFAPLDNDWRAALADVRGVIADAVATPPTQAEIDREVAEFDAQFAAGVEQRRVMVGSDLADNIVQAVDIREAVAAPEVVLDVFRGMAAKRTPAAILARTRALFAGDVVRGTYLTPAVGEADADALRAALRAPVEADDSARLADRTLSFADLPPIGEPGIITRRGTVGLYEMEQVDFDNGARALLWQTDAEPGRVVVKLRFGAGQRAFDADDAVYAGLGAQALIGSGLGTLGQEELDRITTGRRMGFTLGIEEDTFSFTAQTRDADLADQLYLFAAKLAQPRWDANPVLRAKASQRLTFESQQATPAGVLGRELDWLLGDREARLKAPDIAMIDAATPEGFRAVWEPLLATGEVEILVFGDFEKDAAVAALAKTIGALPERAPVSPDVLARSPRFPEQAGTPVILTHRGDPDQAAVAMAWQIGAGFDGVRTARQMQVLTDLFNNRLMDALRERAGASYAPQVGANWPLNMQSGGTITAIAQLQPKDVDVFFTLAQGIARDLATAPPSQEELNRVIEPLNQAIRRASTGNTFWLYQVEGGTTDPRRYAAATTLLQDFTQISPDELQTLAARYLATGNVLKIAVVPEASADGAASR